MRTCAVSLMLAACALVPLAAEDKPAWQVIVLANDATLQGQDATLRGHVQREADKYHIRTERGTTILPASQVLKVFDTVEEAYAFLRGRANLRDPDEQCRIACWCLSVGLETEARIAVEVALVLRPSHPQAQQLQKVMEEAGRQRSAPPKPIPLARETAPVKRDVTHKPTAPQPLDGWDHALSGQPFVEFTRRVQPILFNGCGTGACHGNLEQPPGDFLVKRPYYSSGVTAQLTRQNLTQTLQRIDRQDYEKSLLLKMAVTPHGKAKYAPLIGRDSPAYRQLEAWVAQVAPKAEQDDGVFASNAASQETPAKEPPPGGSGFAARHTPGPPAQAAPPGRGGMPVPPVPPQEGSDNVRRDAFGTPLTSPRPPGKSAAKPPSGVASWVQQKLFGAPKEPPPSDAPSVDPPEWMSTPPVRSKDPYDPELFNRHMHGRREAPAK